MQCNNVITQAVNRTEQRIISINVYFLATYYFNKYMNTSYL